jgi:hypothetical protein
MKIKTKDLIGAALDWAVAKCLGHRLTSDGISQLVEISGGLMIVGPVTTGQRIPCGYSPSTRGEQGVEVMTSHDISVIRCDDDWGVDAKGYCNNVRIPVWCATMGQHGPQESTEHQHHDAMYQIYVSEVVYGPTPLVAAMRCYVASRLGAEVEIPDQLTT